MIRKAGDIINEYLREGKLAANRSTPIGAGSYGSVYESDVPGRVMKQMHQADMAGLMEKEANLQAIAADIGMAPRVTGLETFPAGIGNRIEMQDVRNNFENAFEADAGNLKALRQTDLRVAQQLGQLALRGVRLEDRNPANVFKHKMTGRPMQLDFGIAGKITDNSEKAAWLSQVTAEGFEAAGIPEMGSILRATVMDMLEGGDVEDALDVARQGFGRLMQIKKTIQ